VRALLENRSRYEKRAGEIGEEQLYKEEPKARGYLRAREGYRLFENRDELCRRLNEDVKANREWLMETLEYPLASPPSIPTQ
jgi:deoxyhypusine synthase